MTLIDAVERAHRLDKSEAEAFQEYDRRTNKKMAQHNRSGGDVRKPVRKVKGASEGDKWDRAKFNSRKAAQILSRKDPLKDDEGNPTPAAMQFKRWGEKIPDTLEDVQGILSRANRQKERYRPDTAFTLGYLDVMSDRFDQRGQGVPCGKSWIPRSKKCSRDKARQTSKEAKQKGTQKARDRVNLKKEIAGNIAEGRTKAFVKPSAKSVGENGPTLERGFSIRDVPVTTKAFNSLPAENRKKILALKDEFESLGYIDARTQIGPDQARRQTRRQKSEIGNTAVRAFRIEDQVRDLLKPPEQKKAELDQAQRKELEAKLSAVANEIKVQETYNRKAIESKRNNASKQAYQEMLKRKAEMEQQLSGRSDSFWQGYMDVMRADAETQASPEDDKELAQMIVSALEDGYTSGIEALLSYGMDGDTIYGRFRDEGKTFGYTLTGGEIAYWQLRGQARTDSLLDEPVYRADRKMMKGAKGKKCGIGTKCRYGCIQSTKTCRIEPSPSAKGFIRRAMELIKKVIGKGKSEADREVLASAKQTAKEGKALGNQGKAEMDRQAQMEQQSGNLAQLRKMKRKDSSDPWLQGYLDVMESRFDQRGQGVPCGQSWIPRSKKCSKEKAKTTSKEARKRGAEKARDRASLKTEIKRAGRVRDLKKSVQERYQKLQSGEIPVEQRARIRSEQGKEVGELSNLVMQQGLERNKRKAAKEGGPKNVDLPTATVVAMSKPRASQFGDDPMVGVKFKFEDGREEWKNFSSRDADFQKLKRGQSYSVSTNRWTGRISNVFDPVEKPKPKPVKKAKSEGDRAKNSSVDTDDQVFSYADGTQVRVRSYNLNYIDQTQGGKGEQTRKEYTVEMKPPGKRTFRSTSVSLRNREAAQNWLNEFNESVGQQPTKSEPYQQKRPTQKSTGKQKAEFNEALRKTALNAYRDPESRLNEIFEKTGADTPEKMEREFSKIRDNLGDRLTGQQRSGFRDLEAAYQKRIARDRSRQIETAPMQIRKPKTFVGAISIDSAESEAWQRGYHDVMQSKVTA